MNFRISALCLALLFLSCNSVKRNQKYLAQGNYERAIDLAIKKIEKDKHSDKNDGHILLLEEAFQKAVDQDMRRLDFLKKDGRSETSREKYNLYLRLNGRQDRIRPLLPLYSASLGRNGKFNFKNYDTEIIESRKQLLAYLYDEAETYMALQNTLDYRRAYAIYNEIDMLQANFRNVNDRKEDAHFFGTDHVHVILDNQSGQIMPHLLEKELLDFNTYGLNDFWTVYHSERSQDVTYNFGIVLNFKEIGISPERILEREVTRNKRIKDGFVYKRDQNGEILKDDNDEPIKIDRYKKVAAKLFITEQSKSVLVSADVIYKNLMENRRINIHPLTTEFIFNNNFATFQGDKRALSDEDLILIENRFVPFPPNEQMVLDAGGAIKERLKDILNGNSFR